MGFLASILASFLPMLLYTIIIYWMDRFEKEPKILIGIVFSWGAVIAAAVAFLINTIMGIGIFLMTGSETATEVTTGSLIAPIIEETLKGFAVLCIFLMFRKEFDSILDGIIYAAVAALGFAATENAYYIYNFGFLEEGWTGFWGMFFIRIIGVAWQHPFYTAFIGIGFAISRLNRNTGIQIAAPLLGWLAAIFTHSVHNTIASLGTEFFCVLGSMLDWFGWFAMLTFMIIMVFREQKLLIFHLESEVESGMITRAQYLTAISAWKQVTSRTAALLTGKFKSTSRFFQLCGEISHKKNQLSRVGEESGNSIFIEQLRNELAQESAKLGF